MIKEKKIDEFYYSEEIIFSMVFLSLGKSLCMVSQATFSETEKYSWAIMLRIPTILDQGDSFIHILFGNHEELSF